MNYQIEMVRDDIRIWQILGETVYQPAPINDDGQDEPLTPQIAVLHASCLRIETGIEVVWGVSVPRGARNYEADISYDQGSTWDVLSPYGPASTGRAQMRQVDGPVSVRARAYGRTGLHGDYKVTTFTTVAPVVDGRQTSIVNLPPIDYAGFTDEVRARIDHILAVEAYAQAVSAQAQANFASALGRADEALAKALQSLGNDASNTAAITAESSARLTADQATTSQLNVAVSRIDGNTAAIISEASTQSDAVSAQATRTDVLVAQTNADRAYFLSEQQVRIGTDGALSTRLDAVVATANGNTAAILSEQRARADAISAEASRIDGLSATVGGNISAIIAEQKARADAVSAQASRTDSLTAQTDADRVYFLHEQQVRVDVDQAIGRRLDYLDVTSSGNTAAIINEQNARADAISAEASRTEGLRADVIGINGFLEAGINNEAKARIDNVTALISSTTDILARTNAGTAAGRFSLQAVSGPGGVSARIQALLATQYGGQTFGAGYYLDLMPDGTSRFVIDANAFYITSNGQSTPAFSFDGYTLTIPSLRVTQSIILPNAASDKYIPTVENFDAGAPGGPGDGWRLLPGSDFSFNVDSNPGWGVIFTITTDLKVNVAGTNQATTTGSLETAVAINGNIYNGVASNAAVTSAGGGLSNNVTKQTGRIGTNGFEIFGPGSTTLAIYYRWRSSSGSTAQILFAQIKALVVKR